MESGEAPSDSLFTSVALLSFAHDKCSAEICWITQENNTKHIYVAQTLIT